MSEVRIEPGLQVDSALPPAADRRLRVLFFAQRFPFPMDTGGKIRTGKMLEALHRLLDVTFIANVEHPKDDPYLEAATRVCARFVPVPWQEVTRESWRFYARVLSRLGSRLPIGVINDYSPELERALTRELARSQYDVVVCDFLQPSLNLRKLTGYPTVLFQHNVESVILKRHAETAGNRLMRMFWRSQWRKMHRYESEMCRWFTSVIAVSEVDREVMQREFGATNVHAIPTGVDVDYFAPRDVDVLPNSLVFTGSMDWLPNEDALLFFAEEILPGISAVIPGVTISIVGRKPTPRLLDVLARHPQIRVIGRVEDIRPYVASHAVYIIPLRIGGGTRIKFYEAMAMGKAIVSTSVGAEGLPVVDGENVLIADRPQEFADAVIRLLGDAAERRRLGLAARHFVEANCSWEAAAGVFAEVCHRVARGRCSSSKWAGANRTLAGEPVEAGS